MSFFAGFLLGGIITFFTTVYFAREVIAENVENAETLEELKKKYN